MRWLKALLGLLAMQSVYTSKDLDTAEEASLVGTPKLSSDPLAIVDRPHENFFDIWDSAHTHLDNQDEFHETTFFQNDLTPMRYTVKLAGSSRSADRSFKFDSLFALYDELRNDGSGPISAATAVAAGTAAASYYYGLGSFLMAGSIFAPVTPPVQIVGFGIGLSCIPLGNEIRELMAYETADYLKTSELFTRMDTRVEQIIHDSELNLQRFMDDLKENVHPWGIEEFKQLQQIPVEFKRYLAEFRDGVLSPTKFEEKIGQLDKKTQDRALRIEAKLVSEFDEEKTLMGIKKLQSTEASDSQTIILDSKIKFLTKEASAFHAKFATQEDAIIRNEFKTQMADLGQNIAALSGNRALKLAATSISAVVQLSSWIERLPQFAGKAFPLSITPQLAMVNIAISTILSMGSDNDGLGEYLDAWFNHVLGAIQSAHMANMEAHQQTHRNQLIQLEATVHYGLVTLWGIRRLDDYAKLGLEHDAMMEARLDELMSSEAKHHTVINNKLDDIFDWMSEVSQSEKAVEIQRVLSSLRRSSTEQYVSLMETLAQLSDITTALPAVTDAKSWESTADYQSIKTPTYAYLHMSTVLKELMKEELIDLNVLSSILHLDKDQRHPVLLIQVIAGMLYAVNKQYPHVNESNDKLRITETDLGILEEQLPRLEAHHQLVLALRNPTLQEKLRERLRVEAKKSYATLIDWTNSFYNEASNALGLKAERLQLEEHAETFREDFFADEVMIGNYSCEGAVYDFSRLDNFAGRHAQRFREKAEIYPISWFQGYGVTEFRGLHHTEGCDNGKLAMVGPNVGDQDKAPVFKTFMKNRVLVKKRTAWDLHTKRHIIPGSIHFDGLTTAISGMPLPFSMYPVPGKNLPILPYPAAMTGYLPQAFQDVLMSGLGKATFYYDLITDPDNSLNITAYWVSEGGGYAIASVHIPINRSFYATQEDTWRIWSGGPHTLNPQCNQLLIYEDPTLDWSHSWRVQFIPKDYSFLVHGGDGPADKPGLYDQIQNGDLSIVFQENAMVIQAAQLRINDFMREKRLELRDYLIRKLGENPKLFSEWNRYADLLKMTMSLSHMDVAKNPRSKLYSLLYGSSVFKTTYDLRARLEAYTGEGAFIEEWFKELDDSLVQLEKISQQIVLTYTDDIGDRWITVIQSQLQQLIDAHRSASHKPVTVNHWRGGKDADVECELRVDDFKAAWNNRFVRECIKPGSTKIVCDYDDFVQRARHALIPSKPKERMRLSACLYRFDFSQLQLAGVETGSQLLLEDGETSQETSPRTLGIN